MRKYTVPIFALLMLLLPATAFAGTFYEHESSSYYWYVVDDPHFEVVIPATAEGYLERSLFGQATLEMFFGQNGPRFVVASVTSPNVTIGKIKSMALAQWEHLFTNVKVEADRRITTSNGTSAYFYAVTASNPSAKQGMIRLVIFQQGNKFAYVMLSCYSDDYNSSAALRNQWIRAVNDFSWLD